MHVPAELAEQCFVTGGDDVYAHVARALVLVPQLRSDALSAHAGKQMREKVNGLCEIVFT